MAKQTQLAVESDLLVNHYADNFCFETKTVANATGSEMVLPVGHPMDDNVPVVDGGEAGTDGLLVGQSVRIPDGESRKVKVLARGPATCKTEGVAAVDYAGDAMTPATIITAMEALDVVFRDESETKETQTT